MVSTGLVAYEDSHGLVHLFWGSLTLTTMAV
jgi:hypothetical protein